jgi:hypothetical protein
MFLSLAFFRDSLKSGRDDPDAFYQIVDGRPMVFTSEPANMQAILATQFPVSFSTTTDTQSKGCRTAGEPDKMAVCPTEHSS